MKHKEYTHLAICPDDLYVTPEGVRQLWDDAKKGLPIIMAMCNVDTTDYDMLAMTYNLPTMKRKGRKFLFMRREDVHYLTDLQGPIITVPWCGTPFCIMERSLVEKIQFVGDINENRDAVDPRTQSFDVQIANSCHQLGVPERVDTRVFFKHVRYVSEILLEKEFPHVIYKGQKTRLQLTAKGEKRKKKPSVFDHPLYQSCDPLQFPERFTELGLPAERPPK